MNLDFSTLYALWATDFFQKNEILLLCFGVIILLLLVIMIVVSINKTKRLKTLQQLNEVAEESNQLKNAFIANMAPRDCLGPAHTVSRMLLLPI